jgi:ABC-type dipeptide/oligopeptide/nickel transport system permease component
MKFVAQRLAWAMVVLLAIATITFGLSHVVPADPAAFLAGQNASEEQIAKIRHQYGLDQSLGKQYVDYLTGLPQGDLGTSIRTRNSVAGDIGQYLPATLELLIAAFAAYLAISLILGVLTAYRAGSFFDGVVRVLAMGGTGMPVFWAAALLQYFFFYKLGWLPLEGRIDPRATPPPHLTGFFTFDALVNGQFGALWAAVQHLVLPAGAIVLSLLAVGTRQVRSAVLDELGQQYVRTARGKGMPELWVLGKHVMRNALNPILTVTGIQFGYMVSWVILVEVAFNWPGIGLYAYQSLQVFDYSPIIAVTLISTVMFVVVNMLSDLAYAALDPRVRHA